MFSRTDKCDGTFGGCNAVMERGRKGERRGRKGIEGKEGGGKEGRERREGEWTVEKGGKKERGREKWKDRSDLKLSLL